MVSVRDRVRFLVRVSVLLGLVLGRFSVRLGLGLVSRLGLRLLLVLVFRYMIQKRFTF